MPLNDNERTLPKGLPSDWGVRMNIQRQSGSLLMKDGDVIEDASGHDRIKFTDTGATIIYDEAENPALTIGIDQTISVEGNIIRASDDGATITMDTDDNVAIGNNLKVGGNIIQASDGGSTITMDTSDNVTIAGKIGAGGNRVTAGTDGLALTSAHCGVITVDTSSAKIDLTLPAVSGNAGLWYKVILICTGTASYIRTASYENKLKGTIIFHTDDAVPQIKGHAAGDIITFLADADIGTILDLWCDGTFWNLVGYGPFGGTVDNTTVGQEG